MKRLFRFFDRRTFVQGATLGLAIVLLEYLGLGMVMYLLHYTMEPAAAGSSGVVGGWVERLGTHQQFVLVAGIGFTLVFLVKSVAVYMLHRRQARVWTEAHRQLAERVLGQVLEADYRVFIERRPSDFAVAVRQFTGYASVCLRAAVQMAADSVMVLLLLILAFWLNWMATLALLAGLSVLAVALKFLVLDRLHELGEVRNDCDSRWNRLCFAIVNAIRDIKIMRLEPELAREFHGIAGTFAAADARFMSLQVIPRLVGETSFVLIVVAAVIVVQVADVNMSGSLAELTTFVVLLTRMIPSVHKIYNSASQYKYCASAMVELEEMAGYLRSNRLPVAPDDSPFEERIDLEDVSFRYGDAEHPALDRISLRVDKGDFLGVVGRSGSGKSTFLDVFVGLLQANGGRIRLDGREVDPFSSDVIRRHIGYVPQQVTLLDESIGYNISLDVDWREHLDDVRAAARGACVDAFIEALPEGYATRAGERGVNMSGGQRQRIGIARALYTRPDILLLDEATSAVDAITESEIMASIQDIVSQKTVIFATHRLAAVRGCDRIVVFAAGRVAGIGPHAQLLRDCPEYRLMIEHDREASRGPAPGGA